MRLSARDPTRTFPWTSAYVGCLRASGLVMLAARFSESDPEQTFAANQLQVNRHLTFSGLTFMALGFR